MKYYETTDQEKAVELAKAAVAADYDGRHPFERRWLEATPEDSYGRRDYHARFLVREGSPPKGYVVAGYGFVLGLDGQGRTICRVKVVV